MFYCHQPEHDEPVLMVYEYDAVDAYYDFDKYVCPVCGDSFKFPKWAYGDTNEFGDEEEYYS